MDTVYRVFVSCMAAFLRGEKASLTLSASDWGRLYTLAKRQSLSGALYTVVDQGEMPDAVRDRLRRDAFLTLTRYESQQQVLQEMTAALTAAEVPHLLFKGAVVRRYYPDPTMRSMGDIDAAVRPPAARMLAHAALTAAGFEKTKEQPDVWVYVRSGVTLELHTAVKRYHTGKQDTEFYEELWTDARLKHGATYYLSDDAEAAFGLSHMAAHFCEGGCGLRQLMDTAVLLARFPERERWHRVLDRLKMTETDRFARHILWLCGEWLGVDVPEGLALPLDGDMEDWMRTRLLADGTFGTDERVMLARMRRERRLQKRGGTAGTLYRWLFPSASYLRRQYAYATHPVLLPAAYIHRLLDGVTKHRRIHTARLQYAKEQQAGLEEEVARFEVLGL